MTLLNKFNSFWEKLSPNIKGFIFILIASATFPIMGTTVKYLTSELHPFQIAFFRCFFGFMIIIPLIIKKNPSKILNTKRYPMHILRGLLGVGAMMAGFTALSMLPLATAVTLGFTRILFLVPLAMLLLGEKPGFLRIFLILLGFLGVIIMIDPSNDNNITYFSASLALLGAFLVSCVKLSVKSLSSSESTLTIQFYYGIISTTALIIPCYLFWTNLNYFQILLMFFAAIVGTIAQMLTIWGLKLGTTTVVMPADYTRLIFAGIYGFVLFNEIPYLNEIIGSFVIIITTMIILYLDNIKKTIK
ncbi:MAG: DMT family transporter [Pelagibacterales bacterium]|jgi:drug/metabolite transporter (DMT)-like permease|nr:DMT family transporter [Pelagibacterales bacterium]